MNDVSPFASSDRTDTVQPGRSGALVALAAHALCRSRVRLALVTLFLTAASVPAQWEEPPTLPTLAELAARGREFRAGSGETLPDPGPSPAAQTIRRFEPFSSDDPRPYWQQNMFRRIADDQAFFVTQWLPSEARRPAFAGAFGFALVGLASSQETSGFDREFGEWVTAGLEPDGLQLAEAFTDVGDIYLFGAVAGAWAISPLVPNERWKRVSSLSAEALINAGIWSTLMKETVSRARPNEPSNGMAFQYESGGARSFPSGHTMAAWSVATVIAIEFRHRPWVRYLAYGMAGAVGWTRIALSSHFLSDVVAGAALGHSIGRMVETRAGVELSDRRIRWSPQVDPRRESVGVMFHLDPS